MNDESTPQEERQPQPSRTRFRDARKAGLLNSAVSRYGAPRDKEYAVTDADIHKVAAAPGVKEKAAAAKDLGLALPKKALDATKSNAVNRASKAKSLLKNKKLIGGVFAALGVIAPFIFFIFWLMLFKNVHMKNLFIDASFAKFDSSVSRTLKEVLEENGAKAKGTADSVVDPNASPEQIILESNGPEVSKIKPSDSDAMSRATRQTRTTDLSPEGSLQETASDLGFDGEIKPLETEGKTSEQIKAEARTEAETEIKGKPTVKDVPDVIKGEETATENSIRGGEKPSVAAEAAAESSSFAKGFSKAINPFIAITFYCIFRDIFVSGKDALNKALTTGAATTMNTVAKTADCQKAGKCSAAQVGAVAEMADSGTDSYYDSCAAKYAANDDASGCVKIDSNYVINHLPDNWAGAGSFINGVLDPSTIPGAGPVLGHVVNPVCKAVLDPRVQVVAATGTLVAVYSAASAAAAAQAAALAAETGPEGAAAAAVGTAAGSYAVLQALGKGVVAVLGTSAGKALFVSTMLHYGGHQFEDMVPSTFGNVMGMGSKVLATNSCRLSGCPTITQDQSQNLDAQVRQEKIARLQHKSIWYRMFSPSNESSITVKIALRTPTTPSAIIGRIGRVFGSISNPTLLTKFAGSSIMAFIAPAHADTVNTNLYGIAERAPILRWSVKENSAWIASQDQTKIANLKKQFDDSTGGHLAESLKADNNKVNTNSSACDDQSNMDMQHYCQYRFQQHITYLFAISKNKQTSLKGAVGGAVTGGGGADTSGVKRGEDTAGRPCPAPTVDVGSAKTFAGANIELCNVGHGTIVNQSAAKAFYDMRQAANTDGVELFGGGFRSYEEQIRLRKAHCPDWQNSPSGSCHPPTAKPGKSMHEEGLAVDFKNAGRGSAVFNWLSKNASRFGIKNLPSESWHWSVNGS